MQVRNIYIKGTMIRNYIKTAWRTMTRNRIYAIINILGLTIGLAASMLVFTVVIDEQSYDRFWSRSKDLYFMYSEDRLGDGIYQKRTHTLQNMGNSLRENFPEVEQFTSANTRAIRFRIGPEHPEGVHTKVLDTDTNALSMFDFKPVEGKLPAFVAGQQNILITSSFREKYFAGEDPVGKVIEDVPSWNSEKQTFLITGVIRDIPQNTHLRADVVLLEKPSNKPLSKQGWGTASRNYYLLKPGTDPDIFAEKVNKWHSEYTENDREQTISHGFQPISDVYLHSAYDGHLEVKGNVNTVYLLYAVGILLLTIACINFINLSLAHAMKRLQETGIRKILGGNRLQLIWQFLSESFLFFTIGTVLAMLIYALALPVTERLIGHGLTYSLLSNPGLLGAALLIIFMTSLITGIYPAWLLSGFKPADSMRGKLHQRSIFTASGLRQSLVVIQFAISIFVLIGLLVIRHQNQFLTSKDLGYDKENLLYIGLRSWEGKGELFKTELMKKPGIVSSSIANWDPVTGSAGLITKREHPFKKGEPVEINIITADFDFIRTLRFRLRTGRQLDPAYGTDIFDMEANWSMEKEQLTQYINSRSALLTATTAGILGIDELNKTIPQIGYTPVGILEDFHKESLHHALGPVFILGSSNPDYAQLFIRSAPGMEKEAQQSLTAVWKDIYPNRLMDAQWMGDLLDKQYAAEQKQQLLLSLFSGLMLFLSAMGVFGLVVHTVQQRVKEIGIRKVLGASVAGIVTLLSKDYVKLVCLAVAIASPVAWWTMSRWLQDFAYRIDIAWWMFVLSGFAAASIALLTVGFQAIRAALANPVDSLRDE